MARFSEHLVCLLLEVCVLLPLTSLVITANRAWMDAAMVNNCRAKNFVSRNDGLGKLSFSGCQGKLVSRHPLVYLALYTFFTILPIIRKIAAIQIWLPRLTDRYICWTFLASSGINFFSEAHIFPHGQSVIVNSDSESLFLQRVFIVLCTIRMRNFYKVCVALISAAIREIPLFIGLREEYSYLPKLNEQ